MQAIGTSSTPSWVNGHKGEKKGTRITCSWFDAKYPVGNLERDAKLTEAKRAREQALQKIATTAKAKAVACEWERECDYDCECWW